MAVTPKHCRNFGFKIGIDQACLEILTSSEPIDFWAKSQECDKCDYTNITKINSHSSPTFIVDTKFPVDLHYQMISDSTNCSQTVHLKEHGFYRWNTTDDNCVNVETITDPLSAYHPLWIAFLVYFLLWLTYYLIKFSYRLIINLLTRLFASTPTAFSELENDLGSPNGTETANLVREQIPNLRQRSRIRSLDTFRGLSIVLMIFVNTHGGKYWFFAHAPWNGLTVADLVFPWFAWIMGVSLTLSLRSQLRSSIRRFKLLRKVILRSIILIALGLIVSNIKDIKALDNLRIPGILQRLGIVYLIVASMEALLLKPQENFIPGRWKFLQDITDSWLQWLIILSLTFIQVFVTLFAPYGHGDGDDCPVGYLGPGGMHDHSKYFNCTGGIAGYIDRSVFGEKHIYQIPTCSWIYQTKVPYDPEGLLGTLTTCLVVFLGVQAGRIIISHHFSKDRILRWVIWSILTGLIAGVLCNFSKNDGIIPVNKNLMTVSYALATSSMAFLLFAFLYFAIDISGFWEGFPFNHAGMNAIILYIGMEVTKNIFPWSWKVEENTHGAYLGQALWTVALWLLIAFCLFKKNIFLSI